jgi:hypothetical protein
MAEQDKELSGGLPAGNQHAKPRQMPRRHYLDIIDIKTAAKLAHTNIFAENVVIGHDENGWPVKVRAGHVIVDCREESRVQ